MQRCLRTRLMFVKIGTTRGFPKSWRNQASTGSRENAKREAETRTHGLVIKPRKDRATQSQGREPGDRSLNLAHGCQATLASHSYKGTLRRGEKIGILCSVCPDSSKVNVCHNLFSNKVLWSGLGYRLNWLARKVLILRRVVSSKTASGKASSRLLIQPGDSHAGVKQEAGRDDRHR